MLQDFIRPVIYNKFKCNFIFVNMPHRTHKCTNTLYDYAIINYNTYVSLMYELKKMERYLRVNLLGPGSRLMKKEFTGPRSHKG
jgi:hypothetical protein